MKESDGKAPARVTRAGKYKYSATDKKKARATMRLYYLF